MHTFGGTSFNQESNQNKSINNLSLKPSEMWKDFDPIQGWMRALTNEIVYLYEEVDNSALKQSLMHHKTNWKRLLSSSKQIPPKQPHSPVFYTSSELFENTSFQIISSNESQINKWNNENKIK